MNIIFMGTPDFAIPVLERLHKHHAIPAVFTAPSKRTGRSQVMTNSPVQQWAQSYDIPVYTPKSLRLPDVQELIESIEPDLVVVAAYGLFIPDTILTLPRLGCWNIHPSLLPKLRGPSPVVTSILQRDIVTGVSIMKLDQNMDSGPILAQHSYHMSFSETASSLTRSLFEIGADLLHDCIARADRDNLVERIAQNDAEATFTSKQRKEDGLINWDSTSQDIEAQIRAYTPWPGSFTYWNGKILKILSANLPTADSDRQFPTGTVTKGPGGTLNILTGNSQIEVSMVQLEGKKAMKPEEFLLGYPSIIGAKLG